MPVNSHSKIAFVGTGIMGSAIAGHILDAGYDVTVTNRTKAKAEGLLARGAAWADTPAEAAKDADVVFTMVGYPTDVEDVYLSTDGLIRVAKRGAWLIDLTTSSPQLARDIHDAAEVEDKHAVDCPVTGGEQGAIDGTLTLILGCTEADAAPILPVLETFSSKVCYFAFSWSTSARTCAWPSSSPRTSRSPSRVPRRPSRSMTCSARSAASAWARRPSACCTPSRPTPPRPASTGASST